MRGGSPLRRAVGASVGLHLLLAVGLGLAGRWRAETPPPAVADNRADPLRIRFAEDEVTVAVAVPAAVEHPSPGPSPTRGGEEDVGIPSSSPPLVGEGPGEGSGAAPAVVEVVFTPTASKPTEPIGGPTPPARPVQASVAHAPGSPNLTSVARHEAPPAGPLDGGAPVHGALAAGQTVVYALDASGSMGEWGKFDAARKALVATLKRQPETVRFQVVVYGSAAYLPLPASGGCVPATASNVARAAEAVAALGRPAGRSDHAAGLRKAAELRPDVVLFFTDAADPPAGFRAALRGTGRPPAVYAARVTADRVGPPAEWR